MDSFEFNKIAAAVLIALITGMVATIVSEEVVKPQKLTHKVLIIEVPPEAHTPEALAPKFEEITPLLAKASVENGQKIAKRCLQCHTMGKGEKAGLGPNLWNIAGAKHGHQEDYAYSSALKEKAGVWEDEDFNHFLYKPKEYIPGTKMSFAGLPKAQERADVVAFLHTLKD